MGHRLLKCHIATLGEALWRDACGSALARTPGEVLWPDAGGTVVARRRLKRSNGTPAEVLWRDACGSTQALRLRKRYGA